MTRQTRLYLVLGLNLVLLIALIIVGLTAHSLGVLAAGGDYLADSAALLLALVAVRVGRRSAARDPGRESKAPASAAMVTAGTLLAVMLVVLVESELRLLHGATEVHGLPVLIVSAIAAVIMAGGVAILPGDTDQDEQVGEGAVMRAITLDTIADAAAAT